MQLRPIHPFPARMAPEIIWRTLDAIPSGAKVLDPMCGSGIVLRAGSERGMDCIGVDMDPLAVLMARVWTTPLDPFRLISEAQEVVREARSLGEAARDLAPDPLTNEFIRYWFAEPQRIQLGNLVATIERRPDISYRDALLLAVSRLIVTKEMKASLARDTAHSRPHKVADRNDFNVYKGFSQAARIIAKRQGDERSLPGPCEVSLGDARSLTSIDDDSVDLVLTSPPYLNAIDYIRGHRLTLVWLGHLLPELREIRSKSIGSEVMFDEEEAPVVLEEFIEGLEANDRFGDRQRGWVARYARDMEAVLGELSRVVRSKRKVVLVVGNSLLRGARVDNAGIVEHLGKSAGLTLTGRKTREIPARRRYLPAPTNTASSKLSARMREEVVLTFGVA